jgi:hypothetical protein
MAQLLACTDCALHQLEALASTRRSERACLRRVRACSGRTLDVITPQLRCSAAAARLTAAASPVDTASAAPPATRGHAP